MTADERQTKFYQAKTPDPFYSALATRLSDFTTNRHEQCGLDSVSFRFPPWQSLDGHPVPPANYASGHASPTSTSSANKK